MKLFDANQQNKFSESKIFDPFEINENDDSIIEYQGELDPDKHYFNQLAHYLSRSSNYYSEETLNKLISLNRLKVSILMGFLCCTQISEVSPPTCRFLCLIWAISTFIFQ